MQSKEAKLSAYTFYTRYDDDNEDDEPVRRIVLVLMSNDKSSVIWYLSQRKITLLSISTLPFHVDGMVK